MFTFASIWVFLLLPLPLLVYRFIRRAPPVQPQHGIVVPFYIQLQQLQQATHVNQKPSYLRLLLLSLIWLLLVTAAAKPQWIGDAQALPISGRDLLLAVDISDSMSQEDMQINNRTVSRLVAVKYVVNEFIERRKGDRLGLVLFGSNAYLQTPLTFDTQSVRLFLKEAQLGFAGPKTAIGDAIGLSVKRLKDRAKNINNPDNNKVIILLTDGTNTSGEVEPIQAAKLAAQINAKIYTIGMGAEEITIRSFFGNRRVNPSASLDEDTLVTIANSTGGQYFRARDTQELQKIYQELDKLEPTEQENEWLRPVKSLFMWPLGIALLLSAFLASITLLIEILHPFIQRLKHQFPNAAGKHK